MLRQLELQPKYTDRIGLFRRDAPPGGRAAFACLFPEPLQTPHNKLLARLLESLIATRFITPKWPHVASAEECFHSRLSKLLAAKNLSATSVWS